MGIYKSALGKPVDMSALASKNEKVRAVGNMKVNARGDSIDGFGKVIKPVTEKVTDRYNKTVVEKSIKPSTQYKKANPHKSFDKQHTSPMQQHASVDIETKQEHSLDFEILEEMTTEELELEQESEEDIEVEKIKSKEFSKKNGK